MNTSVKNGLTLSILQTGTYIYEPSSGFSQQGKRFLYFQRQKTNEYFGKMARLAPLGWEDTRMFAPVQTANRCFRDFQYVEELSPDLFKIV